MSLRIILVGPPGVGKGTQAQLLREKTGAVPLSSGDIFRAEIKGGTELGTLAKKYIDAGELVPDEVTIGMMLNHLQADEVRENGFILDGFPRTVSQAEALTHALKKSGIELDGVVCLIVEREVVVERLSQRLVCRNCGTTFHQTNKPPKVDGVCDNCEGELYTRDDDKPETIRERLRVFAENTKPVIDYYGEIGCLVMVNGDQDFLDVCSEIMSKLNK